jgi:NADPH:quinone reductase-like Zn-dependent oxidoreductase
VKAVRFHARGGPEVLVVEDVPVPEPGPGEVRVAVRAAALNHLDLFVRRGLPIRMQMPHVGGADFAGVVDALGPGVEGLQPGDAVVGHPLLAWGGVPIDRCGERPCGAPTILGEEINGAFCERLVLPAANCVTLPPGLSFEEAAALPVAFVTAWTMLVEKAGLRAGETLLVQGAGSGVGTAAIQIGRLLGARIIAVTSAPKVERLRALGAHEVIDRARGRVELQVRAFTGRRGADVVFEHVGEVSWESSIASAAEHGRIVTCGATTGRVGKTNLVLVFARQLSILGVTLGSRTTLATVLGLAAEKKLRPVIDVVLPLTACRRAHELLEAGAVFGKIVLRVPGDGDVQGAPERAV